MIRKFVIGPLETNCYLFTDEKTGISALVDPAYPDERMLNMLKKEKIEYILITHAHIDHIYGAYAVKELTGAKIVAHSLEKERLLSGEHNLYDTFHSLYGNQGIYQVEYHPLDIDIAVDTGDVITVGKTPITVMHTPGHTNGSVCYLTDREMFCGDLIFAGSYGRVDFPSGNFAEIVDSYRRVCDLEGDHLIYPGHQESTTLRNEREFNPLKSYLYN